jgi:hypothetical protein
MKQTASALATTSVIMRMSISFCAVRFLRWPIFLIIDHFSNLGDQPAPNPFHMAPSSRFRLAREANLMNNY